jgi:hypothetical protein
MGKHKKINIGDKFIVRPDVEVTVVEYYGAHAIVVEDSNGNRRKTTADNLHSGKLVWLRKDGSFKGSPVLAKPKLIRNASPEVGDRFESKNHGWCRILEIQDHSNMTILFEDTGATRSYVYTHVAFTGKVSDPSKPRSDSVHARYPIGSRWKSNNWGWLEILEIKDSQNITIKWEDTGHIQEGVNIAQIKYGSATDEKQYAKEYDYLHPTKGMHYIYVAKLDGRVIYVGKGFGKRYLHCASGGSHNVELNRLYFEGRDIVVEIYKDNLEKKEAELLEKQLITKLDPYCNKRRYSIDYKS